jgi:putative transposase
MGERMTADLVLSALNMALTQRKPQDVIHHSDQGGQSGFNRSTQHLQPGGVYGTTRRMDEEFDWQRRDAVSRRTIASARG